MQRHTASSGRETAQLNRRPSTRKGSSSAATAVRATSTTSESSALLTAVPPQQAWSEQLFHSGGGVSRKTVLTLKEGQDGHPQAVFDATGCRHGSNQDPKLKESSVDRILRSSVKQHTYTYAPHRTPTSFETLRSAYQPLGGADDAVQIRRDVEDAACARECDALAH
jgi:hypothetical protein